MARFPYSWKEMQDEKVLTIVPVGKNGQPLDFQQYTYFAAGY
jgi:hypothetical protein